MCVCEKKKELLEGSTAYQSWVGCVCVCVRSVYARYFGTMRRIEGQGLFVSPEAQPAPSRCHPASRQLRRHQSAAGDARGTLCMSQPRMTHVLPVDPRAWPRRASLGWPRSSRKEKRNATWFVFRALPQPIKKPLTNCRRFLSSICVAGYALFIRLFFHRNHLQPPDFKNQYYLKIGFTHVVSCQSSQLLLAGEIVKHGLLLLAQHPSQGRLPPALIS